MDKYAVIKLGGKQIMVTEGYIFEIEHQKEVNPEVVAYSDGTTIEVGTPVISDVVVKTTVLKEKRSKKIEVARFKSKSRYRKKKSHRQPLSVIKVDSITKGAEKKVAPKVEKVEPVKQAKVKEKSTIRAKEAKK